MASMSHESIRRIRSMFFEGLCVLSAAVALLVLAAVLVFIIVNGAGALNLAFFTQLPAPVGQPGGGMGNAILGTLVVMLVASLISVPLGIFAGVYLAEFGDNQFATLVRFLSDALTGIPSIVVGIVAYVLVVVPMQRFSALAGGLALAILMLPIIVRTTEGILRLVPNSLREAAIALGAPRWRTILTIVVPSASGGIATGTMLAVARGAGETAPLLFTAFGSDFWNASPVNPISTVSLQIYRYAISPYDSWSAEAWAGALVLVALVFGMSLAVRLTLRSKALGGG